MNKVKNMLDHQKLVLENLAGNDEMFRKELRKAGNWLKREERSELREWLLKKGYYKHDKTIKEVLADSI